MANKKENQIHREGKHARRNVQRGMIRSSLDCHRRIAQCTRYATRCTNVDQLDQVDRWRSGTGWQVGGRKRKRTRREAPRQPRTTEPLRKGIRQPEFLRLVDKAGRAQGSFSGLLKGARYTLGSQRASELYSCSPRLFASREKPWRGSKSTVEEAGREPRRPSARRSQRQGEGEKGKNCIFLFTNKQTGWPTVQDRGEH